MIYNTPDGPVNFPDTMSDDDVKGVLQKKYGAPAAPAAPASTTSPGYQPPSWLPGAGVLHKLSNIYEDAYTFHGADPATAGIGNLLRQLGVQNTTPDTATLRAQTAQNRADVGPIGSAAADIAGYATGAGGLKVGEGLAGLMGTGRLARMGGSAIEGAGSAALGTAGYGDLDTGDLLRSAMTGGTISAVTGALPGAVRASTTTQPTALSTDYLKAIEKGAWSQAQNTPVDFRDVNQALSDMRMNMTPGIRAKLGSLESSINTVEREASNTNMLTAGDVANFQQAIMGAARTRGQKAIAGDYGRALDNTLGSAKPVVDRANLASLRAKTVGELDTLIANPASAPAAIPDILAKKGNFYENLHPDLPSMLTATSQMGGPSVAADVANRVARAGISGAIGSGMHAIGLGPLAGIAGTALSSSVVPGVSTAIRTAPIKNSLLAARHLAATGQPLTSPSGSIADVMRLMGYTAGATDVFSPSVSQ